jgi:hypothetical protein
LCQNCEKAALIRESANLDREYHKTNPPRRQPISQGVSMIRLKLANKARASSVTMFEINEPVFFSSGQGLRDSGPSGADPAISTAVQDKR